MTSRDPYGREVRIYFDNTTLGMLDAISAEHYLTRGAIVRALVQRAYMGDIEVTPKFSHSKRFRKRTQEAIARRTAFSTEGKITRARTPRRPPSPDAGDSGPGDTPTT